MIVLRNLISKAEQWENPQDDENYSTELLSIHDDLDNLGIYIMNLRSQAIVNI